MTAGWRSAGLALIEIGALALFWPIAGLALTMLVMPILLILILAPAAAVTAAYKVSFVPCLATAMVFAVARRTLSARLATISTAAAAALFISAWFTLGGGTLPDRSFLAVMGTIAAATSLFGTVPVCLAFPRRRAALSA
jgi:hypothetical protein